MFNYPLPNLDILDGVQNEGTSPYDQYFLSQLTALLSQKQDLHGRRIGTAKDAVASGDYVTKRQLVQNLIGTLAQRPNPATVPVGTTYVTTDRSNVTYVQKDGHWYYLSGIQLVTLSPNTKPSPSVLYDIGYKIYATDFNHEYRWTGLTWKRMNSTSLFIEGFAVAPTEAGWGLCNGGTYTYSKEDGTTGTMSLPDLAGNPEYLKFGGSYITVVNAVAPTISGGSVSGSVTIPSHVHGLSALSNGFNTGNENTPHSHHGTFVSSDLCLDAAPGNPETGSIDVVACSSIGGAITIGTEDATHQHSVTVNFSSEQTDGGGGSSASITSGTVSGITAGTQGTPVAIQFLPYMRL